MNKMKERYIVVQDDFGDMPFVVHTNHSAKKIENLCDKAREHYFEYYEGDINKEEKNLIDFMRTLLPKDSEIIPLPKGTIVNVIEHC